MRGIFDNDEAESEEPEGLPEEHEERSHDKEVTLSTAAQLGIVFCLLLLCGLCFGAGYWVGHRGSAAVAEKTTTQPATPTAAPDQEPLQGSDTVPKPSADAQVPPTQPPDESRGTPPAPTPDNSPTPVPAAPAPKAGPPASPPAAKPESPVHAQTPPAHVAPAQPLTPAHPAYSTRTTEPPAPAAAPEYSPTAGQYVVQIAAVSRFDDANVLVGALRRRGFSAIAQRSSLDGLVHVRIGPFPTHDEASRMAARLLEQGYNAMVQP